MEQNIHVNINLYIWREQSYTLNCISSAGNQLFTEGLRSVLCISEPSGGFRGLRVLDEALSPRSKGGADFFLFISWCGINTGEIALGFFQFRASNPLFLFKGSHSILVDELGLELVSESGLASLCNSALLPLSLSTEGFVLRENLLEGSQTLFLRGLGFELEFAS